MRSLLTLVLLLSSLTCARAAEATIASVWGQWRDAASFDRISEYFGGREKPGKYRVLRTHADARAGYYFLVQLGAAAAPADAQLELQVIAPDRPEPRTFTFPAASPARETVFELGLTGTDWPGGEKARPVAWRIALLAADGHVLAERKSFLWENPAQ